MAYRELSVSHLHEVLRLWLSGLGIRAISSQLVLDRKTVRRYLDCAQELGVTETWLPSQLDEELLASISDRLRPGGSQEKGETWLLCLRERAWLKERVEEGLKLTKICVLLERRVQRTVPYRTLHRFAVEELDFSKPRNTVRLADPAPGKELQVDFGRLGYLEDASANRRRALWALIFTAVLSRHVFVWLTFRQRLEDVIDGFEQAWTFYDGVFGTVIPDNMTSIIKKPDLVSPIINEDFIDYARSRKFSIDAARVRHPKDKARVERAVPFVRESFFKGERFESLAEAQECAVKWCLTTAGLRNHRSTGRQPLEHFNREERPLLLPVPSEPYEVPLVVEVTVGRDHHASVAGALYSLPTEFIGKKVTARVSGGLVRFSYKNRTIKVHGSQSRGGRSTDLNDYPEHKRAYASRNPEEAMKTLRAAGSDIGAFAEKLLSGTRPWSEMRHVYQLLRVLERYGNEPTNNACARAAAHGVYEVKRVEGMLAQALEGENPDSRPPSRTRGKLGRFARPTGDFAGDRSEPETEEQS